MAEALEIVIRAIDAASSVIENITSQIDRLSGAGKGIQGLGKQMESLGGSMTKVGAAATVLTAPLALGLGAATKAAIDFESQTANTFKAFGLEAGTEQAEAMSDAILEMSRTLPYSAEGIAQVATNAGKLGVQRGQMEDFVRTVAQMGTAFDMSADQAGDSIARLSNVFGYMDKQGKIDIEGLTALGNTINYLADTGATSEADIVNAMTRIGGVTRNFGFANNEAAALTAAFLNLGIAPEVVATSLGSMLPTLQAATRQTPKFKNALEELGLTAEQLEGNIKQDATGAIFDFFQRLSKVEDKAGVVQSLFGAGSDSRAIAQLAGDMTQLDKAFASLGKVPTDGLMATFEARSATTANQLQILKNGITEVGITIGSAILPAVNSVVQGLIPMVQGFADFADAHPGIMQVGAAFAAIVGILGPILIIAGSVISAVGTIISAFAGLGAVIGGALNFIMLGISSIAAGFASLSGIFATIGAVISGVFAAISLPVVATIAAILGLATAAYLIIANWKAVKTFFAGLWAGIVAGATQLGAMLSSAMSGAVAAVQAAWASLPGFFAGIWAGIVAAAQAGVAAAVGAIQAGASMAIGAIQNMGAGMVSAVMGIASQMFAAGAAIVNSIADGIRSAIGSVTSAISSVTAAVANFLPGSPVAEGSLRVINSGYAGSQIVRMIASGIQGNPSAGDALNQNLGASSLLSAYAASPATAPAQSGGGAITVNYSPTINTGNGNTDNLTGILRQHKDEILAMIRAEERRKERLSYG